MLRVETEELFHLDANLRVVAVAVEIRCALACGKFDETFEEYFAYLSLFRVHLDPSCGRPVSTYHVAGWSGMANYGSWRPAGSIRSSTPTTKALTSTPNEK